MAKISRLAGATSNVLTVFIQDSTSTTGAGLTGLLYNASGLACYYKRNTGTASVAVTLATITTLGTFASGGLKEIDGTNLPGFYEFHPPDTSFASGAKSVAFLLKGAANMVPCPVEIELTAVDNQDSARFGMSAVNINLSQTGLSPRDLGAVADASLNVGDGLVSAISGAAGKESISGTSYVVKTPSTGTTIRTFTLDSGSTPTSRN